MQDPPAGVAPQAQQRPWQRRHKFRGVGQQLRQRGDGKLILFSACSLMKASEATLRRFVADTGVSAIMGYRRDVGWIESAQLELGLLAWLARRPIANDRPLREALAELRSARDLICELEFRIVPKRPMIGLTRAELTPEPSPATRLPAAAGPVRGPFSKAEIARLQLTVRGGKSFGGKAAFQKLPDCRSPARHARREAPRIQGFKFLARKHDLQALAARESCHGSLPLLLMSSLTHF
jgi:hypothetical protein